MISVCPYIPDVCMELCAHGIYVINKVFFYMNEVGILVYCD